MAQVRQQLVGELLEEIQRKALKGESIATYIKTIRGKLAIQYIDPFTGVETTRMLEGDVTDPESNEEHYIVPLHSEYEVKFFQNRNKPLIKQGKLVPYTPETKEEQLVNAVTDEELEDALSKPYFAVKALLDRFTSPAPVERLLRMAKKMNKKIGTIEAIKERLAELQAEELEG